MQKSVLKIDSPGTLPPKENQKGAACTLKIDVLHTADRRIMGVVERTLTKMVEIPMKAENSKK